VITSDYQRGSVFIASAYASTKPATEVSAGTEDSDNSAVNGENTESQLGTPTVRRMTELGTFALQLQLLEALVVTSILAEGPQRRRTLRSFPRRGANPSAASWAVEVAAARRSYSGH
jgi:hypothetical protein